MRTSVLTVLAVCLCTSVFSGGCGRSGTAEKPLAMRMPPIGREPEPMNTRPNTVSRTYPCGSCGIMRLDKRMPEEVQLNAPFEYTITVSNLTDAVAADVMVREQLAEHFKVLETAPSATLQGGALVWAMGLIPPESSKQITVTGVATKSIPVQQCATMSYVVPACAETNVVEPALILVKEIPEQVLICDTIPLRLRVTNSGTGAARSVEIRDELPRGMQTASGQTNIRIDVGTLQPGQSKEYKAELTALRVGKYDNRATATAAGGLMAESAPTVTMVRQPILTLIKEGPEQRYLGRPVTFLLTVANTGTAVAQNIVLEDTVPPGMSFVSANHLGTLAQGKVVWSLPPLKPRERHLVEVSYKADTEGTFTNRATVRATCADSVTASASTAVRGIPALLLEVIDIDDPIELGSYETYVITVTNQGTSDGTGIQVICGLEQNVEYSSAGGPTTANVQGRVVTFAPLARLAPKAKATWKVVVKAVRPGDVRFKVTMKSDQLRRVVEETESTEMYE